MKTIHLVETDRFNRKNTLIEQILALNPRDGNLALARSRCKVMDALESAPKEGPIEMEDADHATLVAAIEQFPYGISDRDLLKLVDSARVPIEAQGATGPTAA